MSHPARWSLPQALIRIFSLLALTVHPCGVAASGSSDLMHGFREKLESIERSTYEAIPVQIFDSSEFVELWEHSVSYEQVAKELIADAAAPERLKWIAATAMLNLPLDDYLDICEYVTALRRQGKISQALFEWTVFPMYDFSTKTIDYYAHPRMREVLRSIERSALLPQAAETGYTMDYIEYVLSGRAACELDKFRAAGNLANRPRPSDVPSPTC